MIEALGLCEAAHRHGQNHELPETMRVQVSPSGYWDMKVNGYGDMKVSGFRILQRDGTSRF